MSTCRSCGAEIIWALTERGHRMPIDAEPVKAGGNIVFVDGLPANGKRLGVEPGGDGASEYPVRVRLARRDEAGTHVSHFASCPNAGDHRKRKAVPA